jgi:Protein of unknown function, DUF547
MRLKYALVSVALLFGSTCNAAIGIPKPDLWPRWQTHTAQVQLIVEQKDYNSFLQKYRVMGTDGIARIAYGRVTPADRVQLKNQLRYMQAIDVDKLTRNQQFAYWANLYNAVTIDVVLDAYPVASIRKIRGGLFGTGPWNEKTIRVKGEVLSLNDIEHRILRPIWKDPRVHYSVNCASIGCPNIPAQAFTAEGLSEQLDMAARDYINAARAFKLKDGKLIASSIYDWYGSDFGGAAGVVAHAKRYASPEQAKRLSISGIIAGYDYDWNLNLAK